MYNSFKSFAEIRGDIYRQDLIKNHDCYLAHTYPNKKSEKFNEHNNLVIDYCIKLIQYHSIDDVVDRLIFSISSVTPTDTSKFGNFVKQLFISTFIYHDYGKVNDNFQIQRMKNDNVLFSSKLLKIKAQHSILSAYIFVVHHLSFVDATVWSKEEKQLLLGLIFVFSYPIIKHHSPYLFNGKDDVNYEEEVQQEMKKFLLIFDVEELESYYLKPGHKNLKGENYKDLRIDALFSFKKSFEIFALIKLNFSLLTAADYLATHEYMNSTEGASEGSTSDFGVFNDRKRIEEIVMHLQSYSHNKDTFAKVNDYVFSFPQEKSNTNLNSLRQEMAVSLIQTVCKNTEKKLFYIEAPTGGGKTNLSIITVAELMQANPELNKVFYVFPFTTLITQTYSVLKDSLGLKDSEIAELHSKAGFSSKKEEDQDGLYSSEKEDYIDNLFALYPVTLMSHVKFFNILKTNGKEENYLLHRLANSIVVIDEIQSYNPAIWDKMLYFITQYSKYFNVRFILMSATLPKISALNIGLTQLPDFVDLLPEARKYITNKNFSERVVFNFELFKVETSLEELVCVLINKSKQYASKNGSVKTIIEFIYKKSASEFKQLIETFDHGFDKIFVLSGTVLESRRREIVNFIKRTAKEKVNILLVTTQVVEAGVDIDMDIGFKNVSIIDSDEQLAGRVNRNAYKEHCEVYLFKLDDAKILYGKDFRFSQTRKDIDTEQYQEILRSKDFKFLYEKVMLSIDNKNKPIYKDSFPLYEENLNKLRFNKVDEDFKVIDQQNDSVFVPLKIPVFVEGKDDDILDEVFSKKELEFLQCFNVFSHDNTLDGIEVWEVYETLIETSSQKRRKKEAFDIKGKIDYKILQGIMSKFTFSMMHHSKDIKKITEGFGEEKLGYMYFSHWDELRTEGKPYSYNDGLNSKAFSDSYFI